MGTILGVPLTLVLHRISADFTQSVQGTSPQTEGPNKSLP